MQFYVMHDPRTEDWNYAANVYDMKPKHQGDAPRCPACKEYVGMLPWLPPYRAEIVVHGGLLGDAIECGAAELLVSDRFRAAWEAEGLRGIDEFFPLERVRVRPARLGRRPLTYFHIALRLFGTQVDVSRSLIEYDRPITCEKCKSGDVDSVRGFAIDEASWTGEDLFMAWGICGEMIATDRVRQLRDKYELTNTNMTPVEEYLWYPHKQWTPHCFYPLDGSTPPPAPEIDPKAN